MLIALVSLGAIVAAGGLLWGFTGNGGGTTTIDEQQALFFRAKMDELQAKIDGLLDEIRYATTESKVRNAMSKINLLISKYGREFGFDTSALRKEAERRSNSTARAWCVRKADAQVRRGDMWKAVSFLESGKEFCQSEAHRQSLDERVGKIISKQNDFA
jgi:hypothetical protein